MPKLRAHAIAFPLDGCVAGPGQAVEDPFGGGEALHQWVLAPSFGKRLLGGGGRPCVDPARVEGHEVVDCTSNPAAAPVGLAKIAGVG